MSLPMFRYHPDPLATGSIVPSDLRCACCGQARGYVYQGPVYARAQQRGALCPWCIADGSAATRFEAEFTDAAGVGGDGAWEEVPPSVVDEVALRTPGFAGWQQARWWTHCADAAHFLGTAGHRELTQQWPDAIEVIRLGSGLNDAAWEHYFRALDARGNPTAYVFRCTRCGRHGGYADGT